MRLDGTDLTYQWRPFARRRFAAKGGAVHLTETALVCEGEVYKVSFFGTEGLLRGAVSERTTVTVPYSRIDRARVRRWPAGRVFGAVLLATPLALGALVLATEGASEAAGAFIAFAIIFGPPAGYLLWRVRPGYVVRFRGRDGTRRAVQFRIRRKAVRAAFAAKMEVYRRAAAQAVGGTP